MLFTKNKKKFSKYIYWVPEKDFTRVKKKLADESIKLIKARMTPCEVLKASGMKVYYATPELWFRKCFRQSSWYQASSKGNKYLLVSDKKLPDSYDKFYEVLLEESDFYPSFLPNRQELYELVDSPCYQVNKPEQWEKVTLKEKILFKIIFTLTGFWKWDESCNTYWLTQKANHANFLCQRFTTDMKGESVPYSISDNSGVCSACLEFFNVISEDTRKLVRACPGAIISGGLKLRTYYDIQPLKNKQKRE
jgi:hypothetical protein